MFNSDFKHVHPTFMIAKYVLYMYVANNQSTIVCSIIIDVHTYITQRFIVCWEQGSRRTQNDSNPDELLTF